MGDVVPPSLPSRDHHGGIIDENQHESQQVDAMERNVKGLSLEAAGTNGGAGNIENSEKVLNLLNQRQLELYNLPIMNESSDIFAVKSLSAEMIQEKLGKLFSESENESDNDNYKDDVDKPVDNDKDDAKSKGDDFWKQVLLDDEKTVGRLSHGDELIQHLIKGIPNSSRAVVYLKIFRVRYQLTKDRYNNLLKKAEKVEISDSIKEQIEDSKIRDAVKVFSYYITEVLSSNINKLDIINNNNSNDSEILSSNVTELSMLLIQRFGHILGSIPGTADFLQLEDVMYVFLKLNKLISNLNLSELIYEINRSLEDIDLECMLHISKQGIQLSQMIKQEIHNFFGRSNIDNNVLVQILDLIVFYGFSVLCQVFGYLFKCNSESILQKSGDELAHFLFSEEFYSVINTTTKDKLFQSITEIEPSIIKFENEYYLIYMNSLNNNNNELINAKEINEELNKTINQLTSEIDNLTSTHDEILSQRATFEEELDKNQAKHDELLAKFTDLQTKFNQLTMKENLNNTNEANKEFSERNNELQAQVDQMKDTIRAKEEKLAKYEKQ